MEEDKRRLFRVLTIVGVAAVALAFAGAGVVLVARSRRKSRFQRAAARARRVLRRDVSHLGRKVRSRVDHVAH